VILVGDSLGMVILGYEDTTKVTMQDMARHTAAVRRGAGKTYIVADMPFLSYGCDIRESVLNAGKLMQEGSCNAVKLEGGRGMCDTVKAIVNVGIPVVGHIGYTPQSVNLFGRAMVRGRSYETAKGIVEDALLLEKAGVCCIVLELVPRGISQVITDMISIPTIGIGSGIGCDGQVLVINDIFNMYRDLTPKHSKVYHDLAGIIKDSVYRYACDVRSGGFPEEGNSFDNDQEITERLRKEYGTACKDSR
jgi:3-methyl-2-oxobutanoate hydroxymethyltransferase